MAHGLVLRMQDYVKKDSRKEITSPLKDSAFVPCDEPDAFSVEVVQIIKSWLLVTKNSRNSKMEFFSLLRETLLFMLSSKWAKCTKQNDLLHVFGSYHQKFSSIIKNASMIRNSVLQLSNDPWGNPFFEWTELTLGRLTVADEKVQDYFAQEPEEIVLARVQSFVQHNNLPPALGLAKLSFLYHSRIKKNLAKPRSTVLKESKKARSSLEDISCEGHASIDWYMTLLERKKSLSLIIKEVSQLTCHEGVEIICRVKQNQRFENLALSLVQMFIMQDLIKKSKYCCTKNLFDLFCLIHKERNSSVKEITESIGKIFAAHAPSSSHLYLLVDVMWERFGAKFFTLYVEFCIRGLTADINYLEIAKTDEDALYDRSELEVHIATMFAKLSTLFNYFEAKRDCLFSAFILKPSKSRYNYLRGLNETIHAQELEAAENPSLNMPFRECTCNRICNGYCKVSFCDNTFEHPLLKKGIRNVPFTLVEDLVSVLESIRCLKFQYNMFSWKDAEPKLASYLKSFFLRNRNSVSSVDSNLTKSIPQKIFSEDDSNSVLGVTAVDIARNKILSPQALVKRKNSSDNSKSDFLDVGANIEVNSDDSSSKRMKISLPPIKQSPEASVNSIYKFTINDAIEKVIRSSLNEKLAKEQPAVSMTAPTTKEPSYKNNNHPINLSDKMPSVLPEKQRLYGSTSVTTPGTNLVTKNKLLTSKHEYKQSYVSKPSISSPPVQQSFERPSVVMKPENLIDKKYNIPYETSRHSLLKSSLLKPESHHKPISYVGLKSALSHKMEHYRNSHAQKSIEDAQPKLTDPTINQNSGHLGALNLSSGRHSDMQHSKSMLQTPHQYPLDLKCNKNSDEAYKKNRPVETFSESVVNQNFQYSNPVTDKTSNTPSVKTKAIDRNSVIQHTMQHLDIKIPRNLTVSILPDNAQQRDATNLPAFKVKVPNTNLPKNNFLSANLVIPRPLSSSSSSKAVASDKASSHNKQEMITIPGILAPKSVIKRSWEVPSVHGKVELKKTVHSSASVKKIYSHPYQSQPMPMNREWPQEVISKTEKVTQRETTYQIYGTKHIPDNYNLGKWKTAGDVIDSVQSPISSTDSQLLPMNSVQSSVSSPNSRSPSLSYLSANNSRTASPFSNNMVASNSRTASPFSNKMVANNSRTASPFSNNKVANNSRTASPFSNNMVTNNSRTASPYSNSITANNSRTASPFSNNMVANDSRTASMFSSNMVSHKSHHSNTPTSASDFEKPLISYSYKNDSVSVPNLLQSKPSYKVKDNILNSGQEKRVLPVISSPSLLKNTLTSQSVPHSVKGNNSQTVQYLGYSNSKVLHGSSTATTGVAPHSNGNSSIPNNRFQSNLSRVDTSYSLASVLVEDDKGIVVFKAAKSEIPQRHSTSSMCCSPSEVNPCQNCSLLPEDINFNSPSTNTQIFNPQSASIDSPNQIKYETVDSNEEKELFQNQQLLPMPPPNEYTTCHICSMTCSLSNYQLHLEKYHSFETTRKNELCSSVADNFDLYDLQSTSFDSFQTNNTKDMTNDIYNGDPVENETAGIDLPPQNQNNINLCLNLINNSFDQVADYFDNVESSVTYSDDSSFKFSELLQNPQNNTLVRFENNNESTAGTLEDINIENSLIENNICGNGNNLDEMLQFLDPNTNLTESSRHPESLDPNKCMTLSRTEDSGTNLPNNNQLLGGSKIKKKFYCKMCLKKKLRKFASRSSLYKHVKTFHPEVGINDCIGHLATDQILLKDFNPSSTCNTSRTSDSKITFHQNVKLNQTAIEASSFNSDYQQSSQIEMSNLPLKNNTSTTMNAVAPFDQLNQKLTFPDPGRKTKHPQFKCLYCGKMLTGIYMKQHVAKMHPNALLKESITSNLSANYVSTPLPGELKPSFPLASDLSQNVDSNTCLSASDALKTDEKNDNVTLKHSGFIDANIIPSPKFIKRNEEHIEQNIDLNHFTNDSTHIIYTCHLCQRRYTSQSFLSKHIKTYHSIDELNESAKSEMSYNGISDSSKFSDMNNSEPNQSLLDMPYESVSESVVSVENNQINESLLHTDSLKVNDSFRSFESYSNCSPSNIDLSTYYQHQIPEVKTFLPVPKEKDINSVHTSAEIQHYVDTSAEIQHTYSDLLPDADYEMNPDSSIPLQVSPNNSAESEKNHSTGDNHSSSKIVSELPVNSKKLPRFTCRICLKTYTGKAYFRKHYKTKHNRMVSDKELEAWQNFSDPIKSRGKKKKKIEPVNQYSRRLSLEVSKSNYSEINDLLSAEARSNEKVLCKICSKEYSCRGNLKMHMKNVHNYRGLRQRMVDGKKKEVQCHICLKLLQNTSLKLHVQSAHGDAFLTDDQEAYTVSNVVALSSVNYCSENVHPPLSNLDDCNFPNQSNSVGLSSGNSLGTDSNISLPSTRLPRNEFKNLNQKENASDINYLNNLKRVADFGARNPSNTQCNNDMRKGVMDVSSPKHLNGSSNDTASKREFELKNGTDTKAVNDDLESELFNKDLAVDQSDFDGDFSLSDIPTSEDECTNFMDSVMLEPEFMADSSFLNFEDQPFTSFESNHGLEPISDYTATSKTVDEYVTDNKSNKLENTRTEPLFTVENNLNIGSDSKSQLTESQKHFGDVKLSSTSISEILTESEPSKDFKEIELSSCTSIPETLTEFHIGGDHSFIQKLDSVSDLRQKDEDSKSISPSVNFKTDLNVCSTESSTDDDLSVPLEKLTDSDSEIKPNSNFSINVQESKANSNECRFCHKMFSSMKFLSKHLKISHNIPLLKKQKSAKQKLVQNVKLSPPLLTQHHNYGLDALPTSLENPPNPTEKSVSENETKFISISNEISNCNNADFSPVIANQLSYSKDRTLSLHSTDSVLSCEKIEAPSTSDATNIMKKVSADCKFEPRKKPKLSYSSDIEMSVDPDSVTINAQNDLEYDSKKPIKTGNISDNPNDEDGNGHIAENLESKHVFCTASGDLENGQVSPPVADDHKMELVPDLISGHHEIEHVPHSVSDDHSVKRVFTSVSDDHEARLPSNSISGESKIEDGSHSVSCDHEIKQADLSGSPANEYQDEISKAPILPCIIKVLKNKENAIIYQIDKSKGDDSSSNSVNNESKSSPGFKKFFTKRKNSRNYRKKLNQNPYQSSLYCRQRSLMRRKPRIVRRNKIFKRSRKKVIKPVIQTFKYPNDVMSFLKNNKQPVVLLTRLKEETLSYYNYNACTLKKENEETFSLQKINVFDVPHSEPSDITELTFSCGGFTHNEAHIDSNNIPIDPVIKFRRNSAVQETANVAVVLHKLQIDVNSTVVPLSDDFEMSTYKTFVQSPILKECRVVLTKLQL